MGDREANSIFTIYNDIMYGGSLSYSYIGKFESPLISAPSSTTINMELKKYDDYIQPYFYLISDPDFYDQDSYTLKFNVSWNQYNNNLYLDGEIGSNLETEVRIVLTKLKNLDFM